MCVGENNRTTCRRIGGAAIGGSEICAGRELDAPARRAFGQHRRNRPVVAARVTRPQIDRRITRQLHIGPRRDHGAPRQRRLRHRLHGGRQHDVLGPDHCSDLCGAAQRRASAELHAWTGNEVSRQHGARGRMDAAIGVVDVRRQYGTGSECVASGQDGIHRQRRADRQCHRGNGNVEVKRGILRKHGADFQHDAVDRNGDVGAIGNMLVVLGQALFGKIPALVSRGRGRRRKAVADAAIDVEITRRTQHQCARFAKAASRCIERR